MIFFSSVVDEKIEEGEEKLFHSEPALPATIPAEEKDKADAGKLLQEAINRNALFVPNELFDKLVTNYEMAEQQYGKTFLELVTGYSGSLLRKNIKIPEFQRELRKRIEGKVAELQKKEFLNKEYKPTEKGLEIASLVLYTEELDRLQARGLFGDREGKKKSLAGDPGETHEYRKGDSYHNLALRRSMKRAVRRGHTALGVRDLETFERKSTGQVELVYLLDASGSMRGEKLEMAKKAGIALAYQALEKKDKVGLLVFSKEVCKEVMPSDNFPHLLRAISPVRASGETNIADALRKTLPLFSSPSSSLQSKAKHVLLLSDALPTSGEQPVEETLAAVSLVRNAGVTISLVGIGLDKKGKEIAKKIAEMGEGRLFLVRNVAELDVVVLEDYWEVKGE